MLLFISEISATDYPNYPPPLPPPRQKVVEAQLLYLFITCPYIFNYLTKKLLHIFCGITNNCCFHNCNYFSNYAFILTYLIPFLFFANQFRNELFPLQPGGLLNRWSQVKGRKTCLVSGARCPVLRHCVYASVRKASAS